jgi:hypothetical protein
MPVGGYLESCIEKLQISQVENVPGRLVCD